MTLVLALEANTSTVRHGPSAHGQALSTDEDAALALAADGSRLAYLELSKLARGDDEAVREALIRGARRVFKQLLGAKPYVDAVVIRLPHA